ncbi:MAG TPA: methyltransferase domain-containing protein [Burkholderiaceae bacterium]|nr:methyltransferase domain-containing protein [Burkholderiaceae bacterium]
MPLGPGTSALTPSIVDPPRIPARIETVRGQFQRRAGRLEAHDAILREVGRRLRERLAIIRIDPQWILDVGCGRGDERLPLLQRYPRATWVGLDVAPAMLEAAGGPAGGWAAAWRRRLQRRARALVACAEAGSLPIGRATVDLLYSNLVLNWHPAPHTVFPEWHRVLREGGLVMFSSFGPDTLKELRAACVRAGLRAVPMPFVDMHDFGDMLVASGFSTPVMDVEVLRLTYRSAGDLLAEVRALGGNPRDDRAAGLPSGRSARALRSALDDMRDREGRIALTFEVAYGHAWKQAPRPPREAVATFPVDALRAGLHRSRDK